MMTKQEWEEYKEQNPLFRAEALDQYINSDHPYKKTNNTTNGSNNNTVSNED